MRILRGKDGFVKPLIILFIIAAAIYSGVQYGMPYYRHSAFRSDVKDIARIEFSDPKRLRAQVYEAAVSYKIPVQENDIVVTAEEKTYRVKVSWTDTVNIFGIYQKKLDFNIDVRG